MKMKENYGEGGGGAGGWGGGDKRMQIKKMKTNGVCVEEDVEKRMGSERRKEYPPAHPISKKKRECL